MSQKLRLSSLLAKSPQREPRIVFQAEPGLGVEAARHEHHRLHARVSGPRLQRSVRTVSLGDHAEPGGVDAGLIVEKADPAAYGLRIARAERERGDTALADRLGQRRVSGSCVVRVGSKKEYGRGRVGSGLRQGESARNRRSLRRRERDLALLHPDALSSVAAAPPRARLYSCCTKIRSSSPCSSGSPASSSCFASTRRLWRLTRTCTRSRRRSRP